MRIMSRWLLRGIEKVGMRCSDIFAVYHAEISQNFGANAAHLSEIETT